MLLRTIGAVVLFTGLAAAQAPAAERASRGADRGVQTSSRAYAAQTPAPRARRNTDRDLRAARTPAGGASGTLGRDMQTARTPAERASQNLNRDTRADRFRDAAQAARGDQLPVREEIQQFLPQRRTLQPDVGRPEQEGRLSTDGVRGGLPGTGQNPQR